MDLLTQIKNLGGNEFEVVGTAEKMWNSVSFRGARYQFTLLFDEIGDFIERFNAHEFTMDGHIVADASINQVVDGVRWELVDIDIVVVEG